MNMPKKKNPLMLEIDENYSPTTTEPGDEYYTNGIFVFNITKMFDYQEMNSINLYKYIIA